MLYIGDVKFVDDDRFELLTGSGYSEWKLRFRLIREADAGNYECQISTSPKLSQTFTLKVVGMEFFFLHRINFYFRISMSDSIFPRLVFDFGISRFQYNA